jgi:hypothetical protein
MENILARYVYMLVQIASTSSISFEFICFIKFDDHSLAAYFRNFLVVHIDQWVSSYGISSDPSRTIAGGGAPAPWP